MSVLDDITKPVLPFPVPATAASQNLSGVSALLMGWTWRETTGAAAADIDILDGNDANGAVVATINLNSGQSCRENAPGRGIYLQAGPFLRVNAGTVRGSLWIIWVPRGLSDRAWAADQ